MIHRLLASTALAALLASGAMAQTTAPSTEPMPAQPETEMVVRAEGHLASNLIGETVYNGTGDDAENIGKVTDLVVGDDGNVEAIIVGVGGFLGIGQKEVALEYDLAHWAEREGDRWLVVETTADALEAQNEFDRSAYRPMPADSDVSETKPATAEDLAAAPPPEEGADDMSAAPEEPMGDDTAAAPADEQTGQDMAAEDTGETTDEMAAAPADDEAVTGETTGAVDRSSLQEMPAGQLSADQLMGTAVYGANDEHVGEIGDVILAQDGSVDAIIVDVGGFLGIGEKHVAIGMDKLAFMRDGNDELHLYTDFTQEQLEAQPSYDEGTYAENRDEMRMTVE